MGPLLIGVVCTGAGAILGTLAFYGISNINKIFIKNALHEKEKEMIVLTNKNKKLNKKNKKLKKKINSLYNEIEELTLYYDNNDDDDDDGGDDGDDKDKDLHNGLIDNILDKVSKIGYKNLTEQEKDILKKYKKK